MDRRLSSLLLLTLPLVVAASVRDAAVLGAAKERVLVAVVRDDGKLAPFGVIDGTRWKPAWTPPAKKVEVPIRLTDIPRRWMGEVAFSPTWRLFPDTGEPRDIPVTGTTWAPALCQQQVLLETRDAARDPMRPPVGPFVPMQGLATLGGGRAIRPTLHDAASPRLAEVADALGPEIDRAEQWRLHGEYLGVFIHPHSLAVRRTYPAQVVLLASGPGPDGEVSYFEAVRRYPREAEDADNAWCDIVTYAAGWVHPGGRGGLSVKISDLEITSCLLERVTRRTPLGIVYAGPTPTWVLDARGDDEQVIVYRPPGERDGEILLAAPMGSCRD